MNAIRRKMEGWGSVESGRIRVLLLALMVLAAFVLGALVAVNPLHWSWVAATENQLLHWIHGEGRNASETVEGAQLWTCGMHPQVIQSEPGNCPICGMQLVPLRQEPAPGAEATQSTGGATGERKILFYRNPMNPTITSPVPMKDEMGMDYVPVYADEIEAAAQGGTVVSIDPAVVQNMGVLTETVRRKDVQGYVRTVGVLDYDQDRMVTITTKYSGFVEKTYVNYLGETVEAGDPLFEVYAPELVQTQQELLSAIKFARRLPPDAPEDARTRARSLVDAARQRLSYWDVTEEQVEELERTGKVTRTITVVSPVSGVVMKRVHGLEGMAVTPGMDVIHIADLSSLWLAAEVFEHHLAWLGRGSEATVTLSYFPGRVFRGRVRYVEPSVNEKTRTVRLTLQVPNPDLTLRVGMYANVEFQPVLVRDAVAVPKHAVLRTGKRNLVIVALGGGRFQPREVRLGPEGDGWVQVLSGVEEGDSVVTASQFLIDSEANLQEAIQKMVAGADGDTH